MANEPNTIFERHPRPWKLEHQKETYAGPYSYVVDANGARVADDMGQPWPTILPGKLVDLINADAPQPFIPGWYWINGGRAEPLVFVRELVSKDQRDEWIKNGWTIGKRVEPEF